MSSNEFLLPFRDKSSNIPISNIGLSLYSLLSLVYILLSKNLLEILIIYITSVIFFLIFKARFGKTIMIVLNAYIIVFFLGFSTIFLQQGEVVLSIPLGKWTLNLYDESVNRTILIWIRGLFSVSIVTLYSTILTLQEFIQALRSLFLPNILVTLILLILRYTPMLYEQGLEVKTAQELRGVTSAPFGRRFTSATSRIGGTLIRSMRRGTEVYEAMVLRGLENSEFVGRSKTKLMDWILLPIFAALFSFLIGGVLSWII